MKALCIVNWSARYENNRSRDLKRPEWLPLPNSFDGRGFIELLDHPAGMSHYGAWCLLLAAASRMPLRGLLVSDSLRPHDAKSLAGFTRGNRAIFDEAIPRLLEIGWLEEIEVTGRMLEDLKAKVARHNGDDEATTSTRTLTKKEPQGAAKPQVGAGKPQAPAEKSPLEGEGEGEQEGEGERTDARGGSTSDRWPYERSTPWAATLRAAGAKIGAQNWPQWRQLCAKHGGGNPDQGAMRVAEVAQSVPATERWPDRVEVALTAARDQAPAEAAIASKILRLTL